MIRRININELLLKNDFLFDIQKATLKEDFEVHSHDFSELVLISGGKAIHVVNGIEYPIEAGHVFVMSGDTSHGYKNPENLLLYNLTFDANRMLTTQDDLRKMPGFQALFVLEPVYLKDNQYKSRLILPKDKLDYAVELLEMMLEEYTHSKGGAKTIVQASLSILFVFLSRCCESNETTSRQVLNIAGAVSYIEENYLSDLNIGAVAGKAHLSARQFFRIFKRSYSTTPMEYIIRLRLRHACNLLKNTGLTITEVSFESGFNDPNYFARAFKKEVGVSPRAFRQN